jgi:hypothetical protein
MNRQPDGWRVRRGLLHAMVQSGGDIDVIALTQMEWFGRAIQPQHRLPLHHKHPFAMLLHQPLAFRRGMSDRNDTFNLQPACGQQFDELFIIEPVRNVAEQVRQG